MLGVAVGGAWSGGRRALFPFDQIFQILYMFKIFCIVALGSYVTFSPNLTKFSEGGGGDVFDKPFRNFLPLL